uniref:Uncharacterized protein n=1 Tax=Utricularia reniformis TaxID=192314 RepID=A0A1Y0B3I9_9LAMI|nr:hypothetical protein AEK19_MT1798 [Utricularia reniformis]ART31970.1 hypothetical protein AEK19_MT1798 [Utricularia reniformis]
MFEIADGQPILGQDNRSINSSLVNKNNKDKSS